ncbi:protein FAM50 homolog [Ctenocephalides felis]|uniref:protein FAM50 homolog n=1 Tax=Ctenocephalides felis TaxID=7515 RepID=UPI000E6E1B02|nr:protein FAM50 homolog [Ctenocephalides felis]
MAHYKGAASEAGRAMQLMKKRELAQQEIEYRKKKIEEELKVYNIEKKFATHYDAVEQQLKSSTIGLVTLDEMKAKQEDIVREREKKLAQALLKDQEIDITFSYWDGSGHRRNVIMKKGNSIYQFLQRCLEKLRPEFSELKTIMADQLMYVKEDLILPHHYTFYDFIVTKARGKSGPLFQFDVKDDIRMISDASIEKEESHAGKVLLRSWYERNKHIFPASRWEPYDPTKTYDKYTVKDKKKNK